MPEACEDASMRSNCSSFVPFYASKCSDFKIPSCAPILDSSSLQYLQLLPRDLEVAKDRIIEPAEKASKISEECLTIRQRRRLAKVRHYLEKKKRRLTAASKSHVYKPRKQVAEKRLRIKGRFVTKEQAFKILGVS